MFLRMRHWQLFILNTGIPLVLQFAFIVILFFSGDISVFYLFFITMVLSLGSYFGWMYSIGSGFQKRLPPTVHMNVKLFRFFLFTPLIYMLAFCFFIVSAMIYEKDFMKNPSIFLLIVPLHLFSIF